MAEYETFPGTMISRHGSLREEDIEPFTSMFQREFPTAVDPMSEFYQLQLSYVFNNFQLKKLHNHLPLLKHRHHLVWQALQAAKTEQDQEQLQRLTIERVLLERDIDNVKHELQDCYAKLEGLDRDDRIETRFDRWKQLSQGGEEDHKKLQTEVQGYETQEELQEIFRIWEGVGLNAPSKVARGRDIWEVLSTGEWHKGSCFFHTFLLDVQEEGDHLLPGLIGWGDTDLGAFQGITRRYLANMAAVDDTTEDFLRGLLRGTKLAKTPGNSWGTLKPALTSILLYKPQDIDDIDDN